jgi:penicillin G amidase
VPGLPGILIGATRTRTVDLTVHGPIMTQAGQTTSVDWVGNVGSPDLAALLAINQAASFAQFKRPGQLVRAHPELRLRDAGGNIGAISAGYYPRSARAASRGCR